MGWVPSFVGHRIGPPCIQREIGEVLSRELGQGTMHIERNWYHYSWGVGLGHELYRNDLVMVFLERRVSVFCT